MEREAEQESGRQNRLAKEKSPYLLQHADNPVDWYPWCEEAFERARREDRPIFLSIGYSTCHWCHVMERESFEDDQVARLLNESFVSIKVDREERPDLDSLYMSAGQMLRGAGGWPLNLFLTPAKEPFYAMTYVPKESRFGRAGMMQVIPEVKKLWDTRREALVRDAAEVTAALRESPESGEALTEDVFDHAFTQLLRLYDPVHAGFGSAPKFPMPHYLSFLLRYWKRTGRERALEMVTKTLEAMRRGGVYDQLGFGFFRYSTDSQWLLPHFEKMLYGQALLALAAVEAYQATGDESYARTARETFDYVERDLTGEGGAFLTAQDADSEGGEGRFYLWTKREIEEVLGEAEGAIVARVFGVEEGGNVAEEATGEASGTNVLHFPRPLPEIALELGMETAELEQRVERARQKLFAAREGRPRPAIDDKVLTDWNGLAIAAFAKATQAFGDDHFAVAAGEAADFLLGHMRTPEGRLLHRYREGEAAVPGQLDDYAFFTWGLIELYEATFDVEYLEVALELTAQLIEHFWDGSAGGFYLTADDAEPLPARQKEAYDGALPSGNSVAMLNMLRLGRITGRADLEKRADGVGRAFSEDVDHSPVGYTQLLIALDFVLSRPTEVVVAGSSYDPVTRRMLAEATRPFEPARIVLLRPTEEPESDILRVAPFTADHAAIGGKPTAYVCHRYRCQSPSNDPDQFAKLLEAG
ncbi:MAG: thioredoxin domain-containing protein [Actinobacteria bacterium]|nr:MAG: thioredoxin domain-containing protein [Actinomycetota bacterium]